MESTFLTLEKFMESEGLIEKNLTDVKSGDILSILPEYGAGSVIVKALHFDRNNKIDGVITDRGIFHPNSFAGITNNN